MPHLCPPSSAAFSQSAYPAGVSHSHLDRLVCCVPAMPQAVRLQSGLVGFELCAAWLRVRASRRYLYAAGTAGRKCEHESKCPAECPAWRRGGLAQRCCEDGLPARRPNIPGSVLVTRTRILQGTTSIVPCAMGSYYAHLRCLACRRFTVALFGRRPARCVCGAGRVANRVGNAA